MTNFEEIAKQSAKIRREKIKLIPEDCKINPQYLGSLTNEEFVSTFGELQGLFIEIYADVEKAPFDWGYPSFNNTKELWGSAYNRISDLFGAFCYSGMLQDGKMLVNSVPKSKDYDRNNPNVSFRIAMNKHKKYDMMLEKLNDFGFVIEGYNKKAESFIVTYPPNPILLEVMNLYSEARQHNFGHFSYRWVESPAEQKYDPIFLVEMEHASDKMREIGEWLYAEAERYGFSIDPKEWMGKGCILYKKGSKRFMLVRQGERKPGSNSFVHHDTKIVTKVSFIHAFEREPEKMRELVNRFQQVFRLDDAGKCCHENKCTFRISFAFDGISYKRCGLGNFFFEDITLDDVKAILEMFKIEKKLKPIE